MRKKIVLSCPFCLVLSVWSQDVPGASWLVLVLFSSLLSTFPWRHPSAAQSSTGPACRCRGHIPQGKQIWPMVVTWNKQRKLESSWKCQFSSVCFTPQPKNTSIPRCYNRLQTPFLPRSRHGPSRPHPTQHRWANAIADSTPGWPPLPWVWPPAMSQGLRWLTTVTEKYGGHISTSSQLLKL